MDSLLKADIFFFVTTVITILIGIFLLILMVYLMKIVRNVKNVSDKVKNTVGKISDDIDDKRKNIKEDGLVWQDIVSFFTSKSKRKKTKRSRKKK